MSRTQSQAFIVLLMGIVTHAGATPGVRDDLWVTNGPVYSSVSYGNNTGYSTGSGVGLGTVSGLLDTTFPKVIGTVNGTVNVVITSSTGGWYIGGNFTSVGGVARNNLARINADKTVDTGWDPNVNGTIHTMLLAGTSLVVGGAFTSIDGVARNHLAALVTTQNTGFVTDWNPDADDTVYSMVLFQASLYVGGKFTHVGGKVRNNIAAVNANLDECLNTVVTEWNPDANNPVRSMVSSSDGATLYIGGDFTFVGNKNRNYIAALETVAEGIGTLMITPRSVPGDTLNVKVTDTHLNTVATTAQTVIVVVVNGATGESEKITLTEASSNSCIFTGTVATLSGATAGTNNDGTLNTQAGNILTATYNDAKTSAGGTAVITATDTVVANTDEATVWNPNANGVVRALLLSDNIIYAGGDFTSIGGKSRNSIAALNTLLDINNATAWDPDANGTVRAMLQDSSTLYVGGDFTAIGGQNRNRIAALETDSDINNATSWDPGLDGPVYALARTTTTLYVGGDFNSVADDSRLYIGGDFTYVGPNNGAGVGIDNATTTPQVSSAFPLINGPVYAAFSDGANGWYVGGAFSEVGGVVRNNIAHIEGSGANYIVDADWDPNANGTVLTLLLSGTTLYAGGSYTTMDGQARNRIAALDTAAVASPYITAWDPNADGAVRSMVLSGTTLYAGGDFATIDGDVRSHIAALDTTASFPSIATAWNPGVTGTNSTVNTMILNDGNTALYIGGVFTNAGGALRNNIAEINTGANTATAWDPNANGAIHAMSRSGTDLYVGGSFTVIDGVTRNNAALLNTAGIPPNIAQAWNPNVNNTVRTLLLSGTTLYTGGDFTSIGGIARNHLAAINTAGLASGSAADWLVNAGDSVYVLSLNGTVLYAGGKFSSLGGAVRNHIAALDLVSGSATAWDPGANNVVRAMVMSLDNSRLYVGGDFTVIGGNTRNRVAAIDRVTGLATAWHPDANGAVYAMALNSEGTILYVGGEFTTFDNGDVERNHIATLVTNPANNSAIVNSWNPNATNGAVRAMALSGATLYVGGDFTDSGAIGGQKRNHIAVLSSTNGSAGAWNPDANNNVRAMSLSGNGRLLYVGGDFTTFADGAKVRNHIAVLDTTTVNVTNMLTTWDPDANDVVRAVTLSTDGSVLYVGGDFTGFGGGAASRSRIAALATDGGNPVSWWNTGADAPVYAITASSDGNSLYTGGAFKQINGSVRSHYAVLEALPPVTRAFPVAGAYNVSQDVTLLCDDSFGLGCSITYYTTDGSVPTVTSTSFTVPIVVNTDTTLKYFSIDNAGNQEPVKTSLYVIEATAPVTTATPAGGTLKFNGNQVTLTCSDTGGGGCAKTYYTTDGTTPTTSSTVYAGPVTLSDDATLKFFSVDNAGNSEATINTAMYIVDLSIPRTSATPATRVFDTSELTISLSCDDTPVEVPEPGPGDIPEGAFDPNTGTFPNPADFANPNTTGVTTTLGVVFISVIVNKGTGCAATYYTTDGSTPTIASRFYTGPFTISDNTIIKYFSVDKAGNTEGVQRDSYISIKSHIGIFGPFTLLICLAGIAFRYYFRNPSWR